MRRILAVFLIVCMLCPVGRASENRKYVALTFDDGPSGRFTRRLLDGLEERNVKATFFLCGYRIKDYPSLTQRIFDSGHEIGLHGYSHNDMGKMTYSEAAKEIADTLALLPDGCTPTLLRPPGGSCCDSSAQAAKDAGLALLMWSMDPKDWKILDAPTVEAAVVDHVQNGDIILLHDMSDSSVDAALAIIDRLHRQGFSFVTVSELAAIRGAVLEPGVNYECFR